MPSYLHPRSRSTSTLFTTTLAVSFLVVSLPHMLPCPVDQRRFADSATSLDKRKAVREKHSGDGMMGQRPAQAGLVQDDDLYNTTPSDLARRSRECPVPKPGGMLGNLFGFKASEKSAPVEVVVQPRAQLSKQDKPVPDVP